MKLKTVSTACLFALVLERDLGAQSLAERSSHSRAPNATSTDSASPEWHGWLSGALGVSAGRNYQGVAADVALWVTRNDWAYCLHRSGTSGFFETNSSTYDTSLLIGRRLSPPGVFTLVAAAGLGVGTATTPVGPLRREPTVSLSAQALANLYVVAIGLDAFAAVGATRHFIGIGATVALGGFR